MNAKQKASFKRAAAILEQNRKDTAPYAGRLTEDGDSPRKKEALKQLLGKSKRSKKPH